MYACLSPKAIGIRMPLSEALQLAAATGFEALEFSVLEAANLAAQHGVAYVKGLFAQNSVKVGDFASSVDFNGDDATWQTGMERLPRLADLAQQLGATRCTTWVRPFSDELKFGEHFDTLVRRLRPAAQILSDHGARLGLEFVGPRTLRQGHSFGFISTLEGTLGLCNAVGTGNVGVLLDSFHWFTSHGLAQDIAGLCNQEVVLVHLNDGIDGKGPDEQLDLVRALPGETGVIDLSAFLSELSAIGYDGPVVVEPFSERLKTMSPQDAAAATRDALRKLGL